MNRTIMPNERKNKENVVGYLCDTGKKVPSMKVTVSENKDLSGQRLAAINAISEID